MKREAVSTLSLAKSYLKLEVIVVILSCILTPGTFQSQEIRAVCLDRTANFSL